MTSVLRISLIGVVALWSCVIVWAQEFDGGLVDQDLTLSKWDSPFTIRKHIFVDRDVQLTIEDGVEMRFSPGIMMAVNGTLIAKGTETSRITFTKDAATGAVPQWPDDIRLVDERSVHLGRLQLLYKGKWRGVCANFQNWTAEDTTVACRQLGFQRGNFSFVSYATNDSLYMLYHRPQCLGGEDNIWECAGANTVQIGSRICLHQQTIHLQCEYVAENSPARGNWWGLEFYNSTLRQSQDGTVVMNESASMLHHVDVLYAGVDDLGKPAPAIRASPWGPHLIDVGVRHSALDGANYTDIHTLTVVHRSHFQNNRGHGANIESHFGHLSITDSTFEGNYGNGVKAKFVDGKYPIFDEKETFCRGAITGGSQRFPQMFVGIPNPETGIGPCERKFQTVEGQVITLNVLEMEIEEKANATLEVFDGRDQYSEKIGEYAITNGTLPQGISSSYIYMFVRFKWKALPSSCPLLRDCIKFTILVDTGTETVPELFINNTMSINNTQHGIFIENVRNYAYVNASTVAHNRYGAGIRVFGGAGDVHVNASTIQYNQDNGINMTYGGGWRIINQTTFTSNFGNGLNITVNETRVDNKTRYARHHRTEVSRSDFVLNDGLGVRVGNFCERSFVAINDSSFVGNAGGGVELESCFRLVPAANRTNFTVAYNTFDANYGHAIRIVPLLNAVGVISNNTFTNHPRHVLLLDNSDDFLRSREFTLLPVDYYVHANLFSFNKGFYVAHVRLTEGSSQQKLLFQYNIFTDNEIEGGFPTLNTRTKANAVLIVSSTNVNFSRNHLVNPLSKFEIATHLIDPSAVLSGGAAQYWGDFDDPDVNYGFILTRIFDHYSRFSLARIEYHPVLRTKWLYAPSNQLTWDETPQEIEFKRGADGLTLGGRLTNTLQLDPHTSYTVDRDINVLPEGELRLQEGTELHFQNAVGMFVQGNIQSTQSNPSQQRSVLCLLNMTTAVNSSSVRLVGGVNELEGRLEVRPDIDQEWGTVCDVGWTATDASVVCQQLGYVLHPDEWFVYDNLPGAAGQPIWQSNVRCTQLDLDLTRCASDSHNDHSCTHERDVYVRCKPPTWAGVRLLATASGSRLYNMEVREAGLLDPTALLYSPAISIDYNVHTLEHLHIHDNIATGLEILHNDAYANAKLTHSVVERNFGNGVTTRGSFFEVSFSELSDNMLAGFEYNPTTTNEEALELRRGIDRSKTWVLQEENGNSLFVPNEGYKFLITDELMEESRLYEVEFSASSAYKLVVAVLDWNPDVDQETITIFDGARSSINENTHRWRIEKDLVDFPIQSAGGKLTFRFQVHTLSSGRLTFVLRSKPNSWGYPHPSLDVKNTTLRRNEHGTVTRHYNQPSDQFLDLYFRHRWEYITFYGVHFSDNVREAMHVPSITKYDDLYLPTFEELQVPEKIAEINYEIRSCHFTQNGGGIKGEHNHVEFSNNVWIWEVTSNLFDYNTDGGFDIELPKVNLMQQELYNHSVDVNDTVFEFNDNFEFRVDGFYCNSSIYRNRFHHNHCKTGCVTVTGTEKDIEIHDNEFTENSGRYVLELYMTSHTPYTRWVDGTIMYNNFKRNMRPPGTFHSPSSSPSSYALGIKGLQNITIHRNLFANSEMDYEMVGGQDSSNLENYLDITENWWGTSEQPIIRAKIFDFDDWNNYAIAEYFPFLIGDNFDAPLSSGDKWSPELDPSKPLGGRIEEDLVLYKRAEPYIVERDLTVMFRASLLIEPGVEMQFYPNVGILVLGSLTLRGKEDDRIKLGPIEISSTVKMSDNATVVPSAPSRENREKRHTAPKLHTDVEQNNIQVRLNGGQRENEGFMEFYNGTERRWTIICDDSFNDRTAEVACRSMGLEASNVYVTRTRYYDMFVLGYPKMHEQVIEWFWRQTFICEGNEASLNECRYKQNYQLPRCMEERRYVFVRCGERNLAPEYNFWGNLRFCTPEYEHGDITPGFSNMENVDIFGAGILHEEKIAAIQSVHRVPTTKNVRITNCAWNGYDYIAPRDEFEVSFNELHNNNGYAVGGLVLNGDSDYDNVLSSFTPLLENALPYNTYGLVRMCTTEKLVYVKERILLYFKYRFSTVDCIKIIRSREPRRQVALRFLQLNLYNDTFYKNAVEMYDGEYFDPNMLIGELTPNSTDVDRASRYQTSKYDQDNYYDTMGIRITASAAHGDFGFIAEVVTLPLSPGWKPDLGPGFRQHVHDTAITGNQRGAFYFQNAGELNPSVIIERCRIQDGGIGIYNLTAPHIMSMMVQNSRLMTIANNYIVNNAGGIFVNTTTKTLSTAVYANITNNVMVYNTHGEVLHLEGHHYQSFNVRYNYIAHNNIDFNNVVATFGIALNYSNCNMLNNTGMTIINASVPEQVSIAQKFYGNGIYDNFAIGANHTTIFLRSAKSSFVENYFLNRFNFFEMVTYNRTKFIGGVYPDVDATMNWWGSGNPAFISGRIWDRRDDDELIRVNHEPFHETNSSLLQGRCYPGWRLYEKRCYLYMGGVTPYHEAQAMCRRDRGTLARAYDTGPSRVLERFLGEVVQGSQENYDVHWRAWVHSDWQKEGLCTAIKDYKIDHVDCNMLLPYVCEKSPYVQPEMNWWPIIIALSVTGVVLLIVAILVCCAICKRQQRKEENFRRRDSLQRSLRASKASLAASNVNLSHDVVMQKKRRPPLAGTGGDSFMNLSGVTLDDTTDTFDKPRLDFHRPTTPASTLDYSSTKNLDSSAYFDSDLGPARRPRHHTVDDDDDDGGFGRGPPRPRHDSYDDDPKPARRYVEPIPQRPPFDLNPSTSRGYAEPMPSRGYTEPSPSRGYAEPTPQRPQYDLGPGGYKKPRPMLTRPSTSSSNYDRPFQPGAMNYPLTLENEIAHVSADPTMYRNQAYDERSLDRSRLQSSASGSGSEVQFAGGRRPRPKLTSSRASIEDRPKPKETEM